MHQPFHAFVNRLTHQLRTHTPLIEVMTIHMQCTAGPRKSMARIFYLALAACMTTRTMGATYEVHVSTDCDKLGKTPCYAGIQDAVDKRKDHADHDYVVLVHKVTTCSNFITHVAMSASHMDLHTTLASTKCLPHNTQGDYRNKNWKSDTSRTNFLSNSAVVKIKNINKMTIRAYDLDGEGRPRIQFDGSGAFVFSGSENQDITIEGLEIEGEYVLTV